MKFRGGGKIEVDDEIMSEGCDSEGFWLFILLIDGLGHLVLFIECEMEKKDKANQKKETDESEGKLCQQEPNTCSRSTLKNLLWSMRAFNFI